MPKIPNKKLTVSGNKKPIAKLIGPETDKLIEIWDHPGQPSMTMGRIWFEGLPRVDIYFRKINEVLVVRSFKKTGFEIKTVK